MYEIKCSEVWGGIRNQEQDVTAAGLTASLYSAACEGGKGGDIYYLSVCEGGELTRVAIADVVGHGSIVSEVSQGLYDSLHDHMNDPDGSKVLAALNGLAVARGVSSLTTASIVGYFVVNGAGFFACAGHLPTLVKRRGSDTWGMVEPDDPGDEFANVPLGAVPGASYGQGMVKLQSGDRLLLYTDGVIEAPGPNDELFGQHRLHETLKRLADSSLAELKQGLLAAVREHTGGTLVHDDVTIMALEVR
ncbi:MAG: PP2C family protein-serine/threonine phosphatase [Planctomycetota bacterium]|jgi:sigma-B regulation protein RsbU (phosphoserine phosphatase)